jgi:hypothetical protein
MNILYIGQLFEGGTCRDRMNCLRDLGHNIVEFDTTKYLASGNRLVLATAHRFCMGPPVTNLNTALVQSAEILTRSADIDLIWIDKGRWISQTTLSVLKRMTGSPAIHYSPDAHFLLHRSRVFTAAVPSYDLIVTTKDFEVAEYQNRGARRVHLTGQSFDRLRHYPRKAIAGEESPLTSDIVFIGHMEKAYVPPLRAIVQALPSASISIYGYGWARLLPKEKWLRNVYRGEGLWGDAYPEALSNSKIAIGLLSKQLPETITTRTFEIPACGTFLLAERTATHKTTFKEHVEAEYFSSEEELVSKATYYLRCESERAAIAAAGFKRCVSSGYSNHDRLGEVLSIFNTGAEPGSAVRNVFAPTVLSC